MGFCYNEFQAKNKISFLLSFEGEKKWKMKKQKQNPIFFVSIYSSFASKWLGLIATATDSHRSSCREWPQNWLQSATNRVHETKKTILLLSQNDRNSHAMQTQQLKTITIFLSDSNRNSIFFFRSILCCVRRLCCSGRCYVCTACMRYVRRSVKKISIKINDFTFE